MKEGLVSIITPLYNTEAFIGDTIQSVINQTYSHWELIIIDDFSTDTSRSIAEKYSKEDSRIRVYSLSENRGTAYCRNYGIEQSSGEYIAFIDSDDLWLPNKLEEQIAFMKTHKAHFTYTAYVRIDENDSVGKKVFFPSKRLKYSDMLSSNKIGCLTAVYNAKALGKVYMPNLRKRQDYGLWLQLLKNETYAYGIDKVLAQYRIRTNSISSNKITMLKWNFTLFYKIEKHSLLKSLYFTFLNVISKLFQ